MSRTANDLLGSSASAFSYSSQIPTQNSSVNPYSLAAALLKNEPEGISGSVVNALVFPTYRVLAEDMPPVARTHDRSRPGAHDYAALGPIHPVRMSRRVHRRDTPG